MSEHAALVAGLREYPVCGCNGCWNALQLAADAIEALGTKVERLENHKDVLATALQQSEEARLAAMRERDEALETSLVHLARAEEAEKHEAIAVADNARLRAVARAARKYRVSAEGVIAQELWDALAALDATEGE